jgi:hypothetical protein
MACFLTLARTVQAVLVEPHTYPVQWTVSLEEVLTVVSSFCTCCASARDPDQKRLDVSPAEGCGLPQRTRSPYLERLTGLYDV